MVSSHRPESNRAARETGRGARAFSSEVDTGSRQENASNQESRAPFRFGRNGKGPGRAALYCDTLGAAGKEAPNGTIAPGRQFRPEPVLARM